jgi:hypothetical protein
MSMASDWNSEGKMKHLFRRLAGGVLSAACVISACPTPSCSQAAGADKAVLVSRSNGGKAYLVDFNSGKATRLPIVLAATTRLMLSPDQAYLAVIDVDGISVYQISGTLKDLGRVASSSVLTSAWSNDGKFLSWAQESRTNKDVVVQVYLWDRERNQTKQIL